MALALCSILFVAPLVHAQFRASIHGVVSDQQGALIPGAQLTLTDKDTNATVTTTSNGEGVYNFSALAPNHFKLSVVMKGFQTRVLDNLTLIPEQANAVNVQLQVGAAAETLTVNAVDVPALDTETPAISGTITSNQITHMPSFGRDVTQLAQLTPGVFGDGSRAAAGGAYSLPGTNQGSGANTDAIFKTENGPQVVANGNQTNTNNVQIDGISVSSVTWGGTTSVTPNQDSVETVKVTANSYDAEYGRFAGALIQITSKAGSDKYHGSLFLKAERPGLNAYQRWTSPNPATPKVRDTARYNDFGGSVGGPIWKQKIFAFMAYEELSLGSVAFGQGWYETSSFLKSAPSGSNAAKYLNFPGEGVSADSMIGGTCSQLGLTEGAYCHTISGQGVDVGSKITTALGTHDPTWGGTSSTPGIGNGLDGVADLAYYNTVSPTTKLGRQYYGRLDAQATAKDRLSYMMYWVPLVSQSYNGPARSANFWHNPQVNDAFTAIWIHNFSPNLINEARANTGGWRWNLTAANTQEAFGLAQASFGAVGSEFPALSPNYYGTSAGSIFDQWTYGYQDIVTKTAGKHALKAGGSLTRLYYLNESASSVRPTFIFASIWDFLNDAPYSETGNFNPATGFPTMNRQDNRQNLWAFFAQDNWKILPTLTLNLGVRYSYFGPYYDKGNNLKTVVLGTGASMLTGLTVRTGGNEYQPQKGNFGPQLGFSWAPSRMNNRLTVRGGFGINFNQNEMAITANGISNPGNTVNVSFCCSKASGNTGTGASILYQLPSDLHDLHGFPSNPAAITSIGSNGLPSNAATTLSVTGFDPSVKTIMTYHYSLDTQYDVGHGWVVTLGYQGSTSHHTILQQDMKVLAVAAGIPLNSQLTRVGYYGNKGNANYNALLATVKHNFSRSFQAEAQYTWSKSMDNGSSPYYQDMYPYNLRYSYGRSDYNVQNMFKVFGMYQPNFFHQRLLHSTVDGWTVSGILNMHSGFPWTPSYAGVGNIFYYGSGQNTLRPAAYNGQAKHDLSNAQFEAAPGTAASNYSLGATTYFTQPTYTAVTSGNTATAGSLPQAPGVSRNSFNGPNYRDLDMSLTKGFHLPRIPVLGENANFEVRVDAFNLLNIVNLNLPTTNILSTTFGQSQTAFGSRTVDLQARFSF